MWSGLQALYSIPWIWRVLCRFLRCTGMYNWDRCLLLPSMYYCTSICCGRSGTSSNSCGLNKLSVTNQKFKYFDLSISVCSETKSVCNFSTWLSFDQIGKFHKYDLIRTEQINWLCYAVWVAIFGDCFTSNCYCVLLERQVPQVWFDKDWADKFTLLCCLSCHFWWLFYVQLLLCAFRTFTHLS